LVVKNNTNGRAGGAYVPPFKLAQMMREIEDKSSPEYQRITWEALKKSINGLVNKINSSNVKNIVPELFNENLVRGKGLFARSVMKSQMASPQFSPVFAALVAVTNTKFPELGELVVKRVVLQFRRAFKRNDKSVCVAATKFLASLVNQQVRGVEIVRSLFLFTFSFPSWLVGSFLRFTYARADEFEQYSHRKANDE
jgi:pre-mRNA-splicing factor CWC22